MPNVFLAQCTEKHEKGDIITVTTKYGKENESIIFNLMYEKDNFFFYSIVRADGFNFQEHAKRKAEKLKGYSANALKKGDQFFTASNKDRDFLSLAEPIKIGHHSERRHRKIIEQAQNNMGKFVSQLEKSEDYDRRSEYWERKSETINLSMPESLDFFKYQMEKAQAKHKLLKEDTTKRSHSYSLTYANKELKEMTKKYNLALKLWD